VSLLPDVELELLRVARRPLPDDTGAAATQPHERSVRLRLSGVPLVAFALLALAIGALFLSGLHIRGNVRTPVGFPAHTSTGFPGAPHTQRHGDGVATGVCPLATKSRYLPPRSGCVTVRRADVAGNGRQDLILLYSLLSHTPAGQLGRTGRPSRMYEATQAMLGIARPGANTITTRLDHARAAALLAVAHVNSDPGDELFVQISQISSGATAVAYGFHDGRLIPAGVTLAYGGDSASKAGFDCLAGNPTRVLQRTFELIGPTIDQAWSETDVTYAWHGPRLVKIAQRTLKRRGLPPAHETDVGRGCTAGIG
jgi:hypothetical protein